MLNIEAGLKREDQAILGSIVSRKNANLIIQDNEVDRKRED